VWGSALESQADILERDGGDPSEVAELRTLAATKLRQVKELGGVTTCPLFGQLPSV